MTTSTARRRRTIAAATLLLAVAGVLAACAGEPDTSTSAAPPSSATQQSADAGAGEPSATASPTPTSTVAVVELPTDCSALLTDSVRAELGDTPLNDPAFAPTGVQADGTLICVWRHPSADTVGIMTTISKMSRGPALDMLNKLADEDGFTCYTPDGGTRCEKTWPNPTYPVTDGRTLFWRDDVLIDTVFSDLAPSGYTAAIVASVFD
ncbi:MAG: hypothetical protein ABW024_09270 [Microbacterium sp.]